jgi:gluconolactonase
VYFSNIPASQILTWNPGREQLAVFRDDSRRANGLMFDAQGRLLACEGGAGRITRTDLRTGQMEVLADSFEGNPLAAPNDLFLAGLGRVYFSSRPGPVPSRGYVNAVSRVDPDGSVHQLLRAPDVHMPNGLLVPPGGGVFYLVEADAGPGRNRCIKAYDLHPDGTLSGGRVLIDFYPGRSGDGMTIDSQGNLYVAAGLHNLRGTSETLDTRCGVHVFAPGGQLKEFVPIPEDTVTNCAFGGPDLKTLYVTAGKSVFRIQFDIEGTRR